MQILRQTFLRSPAVQFRCNLSFLCAVASPTDVVTNIIYRASANPRRVALETPVAARDTYALGTVFVRWATQTRLTGRVETGPIYAVILDGHTRSWWRGVVRNETPPLNASITTHRFAETFALNTLAIVIVCTAVTGTRII
jgi:hypothetical protein